MEHSKSKELNLCERIRQTSKTGHRSDQRSKKGILAKLDERISL